MLSLKRFQTITLPQRSMQQGLLPRKNVAAAMELVKLMIDRFVITVRDKDVVFAIGPDIVQLKQPVPTVMGKAKLQPLIDNLYMPSNYATN